MGGIWYFRVPPQAVGKNINSERLASSNSLTQAALRMFYGNVERLKRLAGELFSSVHRHPNSELHILAFSKCLTQYDLHQLLPMLKPEVVPGLLQCAYHVPSTWFDVGQIEKIQGDASGNKPKSETPSSKASEKPLSVEHLASKDANKATSGEV